MLWWLAQNALLAGLLAVVVIVVCRVGRFRPAVQHALWLVVLLKLVTPPLLTWPGVGLTIEPEAELKARPAPESKPLETLQFLAPSQNDLIVTYLRPMELTAEAVMQTQRDPAVAEETLPLAELTVEPPLVVRRWPEWLGPAALRAVLLGAAAMALLQAVRIAHLHRLLSRGRVPPRKLTAEVARLAAQIGVRPPVVRVLPHLASPVVCGLGRPVLLWPMSLCDSLSSLCQRAVIVHELAHLRRRDHWVAWLRTLAGCVWWWNPLYWYVNRQLGLNAELACDAWVIAALPRARRAYAEALLAVAGLASRAAVPVPAVGMSGSRRDFERRLVMVMRDSVPCKAPVLGLVAVGILAFAVLPGLSLGQRPAEQQKKKQEPAKSAPAEKITLDPASVEVHFDTADFVLENTIGALQGDERDRKLKDLEDKLQALLKEVRSLRDSKPATTATTKPKISANPQTKATWAVEAVGAQNFVWTQAQPLGIAVTLAGADGQQHAITLSRVTYKLPKDKSDALAAFLPHIKSSVLESKVEGDGIVVTTTPEVQQTIGQLVGLMQGKTHGAALNIHMPATATTAPPAKR